MRIEAFQPEQRAAVLDLSLRSWEPVLKTMREEVPPFVYDSFYPDGWRERQLADLAAVLDDEPQNVDVCLVDDQVAGWICTRLHPEDSMGEIYVVAVDPEFQCRGIGQALMNHAFTRIRDAGMRMVMVETGGDSGHGPARASYESLGFQGWPVARYFKDLST